MSKRRSYFQRRARFLHRHRHFRVMAEDMYEEFPAIRTTQKGKPVEEQSQGFRHYRDWLMANATKQGRGRKMHRALVRAELKYHALKRDHAGISRIRRSYPRRWR